MFRQKHTRTASVLVLVLTIIMSLFSFPTAAATVTRTTGSTAASKKILALTSSQPRTSSSVSLQSFVAGTRCCFVNNSSRQRHYGQSVSSSLQRYKFHNNNKGALGGGGKPHQKLVVQKRQSQSPLKVHDERDISSTSKQQNIQKFQRGDLLLVEVTRFGRLGASVDVVGYGTHDLENGMIGIEEEPLGSGLILQSEIAYFREARQNLDVVLGEVLPAYVERVRFDEESQRQLLDVSLRPPGYAAKTEQLTTLIVNKLHEQETVDDSDKKVLPIGDKSTPEDINAIFPGISKGSFKKAVSALYKEGKVLPGPYTVTLVDETQQPQTTSKGKTRPIRSNNTTNRKSSQPSSQRRSSNGNNNRKQTR